MAIDPAALAALTATYGAARADLDDSENRTKINYNNALETMRRQQLANSGRMSANMADRGLTQSGIHGQAQLKSQDDFNRSRGLRAEQQALALSTVARKRLEAEQLYNANRNQLMQESMVPQ